MSHVRLKPDILNGWAAYDGLLDAGSKARKATKAASAGGAHKASGAAQATEGDAADLPASKEASRRSKASKQQARVPTRVGPKSHTGDGAIVGARPEGDEQPLALQGRDRAPRGKPPQHGRTKPNDDQARKIQHKKLKLAYLARVQRTLEVARRLEASPCKEDPISFVMQPMDKVCQFAAVICEANKQARVKERSAGHLVCRGSLQAPQ
jgi:hypothetical protein